MRKENRYHKDYPRELEAAWYVLKNFINPIDCSEKGVSHKKDDAGNEIEIPGVFPMNYNADLATVLSGIGKLRPSYMTKLLLHQHLQQTRTFYYRSRHNAIHQEGYGAYDTQALNLPFANDLNITHKSIKYAGMYIILLGFDIDGHNGEKDICEVQNWLKQDYFHQSYWEPSTHYSGRHGYVKLAFPDRLSLNYVISVIEELFKLLDKKRNNMGFDAPIDVPCGLPSTVSLVDNDPYISLEENISKDYTTEPVPIKSEVYTDNYEIDPGMKNDNVDISSFDMSSSSDITDNTQALSSGPFNGKFLKIRRSQTFKIPRFNNTDKDDCNLIDIITFHNLKYYKFSYFKKLLKQLKNELSGNNKKGKENNK